MIPKNPEARFLLLEEAEKAVRVARYHVREAGAKRAAGALARALKSVQGAVRHAARLRDEARLRDNPRIQAAQEVLAKEPVTDGSGAQVVRK